MTEIHTSIDDEDGRYRAVAEVEVPGRPDQVWEAIATGPGIEAWFVPAEVEPHEGGRIVTHHGDFGDSEGVVTAWEPPYRFTYEEPDWMGDDTPVPVWNTEILIEATSGDTCVVRLSSGFLAGGDEWHDAIEPTVQGWRACLRNLRLYLSHFPGQPVTTLLVHQSVADAGAVVGALEAAGLVGVKRGEQVHTSEPVPFLRGVVEDAGPRSITIRTTEPAGGLFEISAAEFDGNAALAIGWYLYGPDGPRTRDQALPDWRAWVKTVAVPGGSADPA